MVTYQKHPKHLTDNDFKKAYEFLIAANNCNEGSLIISKEVKKRSSAMMEEMKKIVRQLRDGVEPKDILLDCLKELSSNVEEQMREELCL